MAPIYALLQVVGVAWAYLSRPCQAIVDIEKMLREANNAAPKNAAPNNAAPNNAAPNNAAPNNAAPGTTSRKVAEHTNNEGGGVKLRMKKIVDNRLGQFDYGAVVKDVDFDADYMADFKMDSFNFAVGNLGHVLGLKACKRSEQYQVFNWMFDSFNRRVPQLKKKHSRDA